MNTWTILSGTPKENYQLDVVEADKNVILKDVILFFTNIMHK